MNRLKTSAAGLLLLAVAATLSMGQGTPPAAAPQQSRLAVVNVIELFNGLLEKSSGDQEIEKLKTGYDAEIRKKQDALEKLQRDLQNQPFVVGSAEHRAMQDDLLMKTMEFQSYSTFTQNKLLLEQRLRIADLYRKINEAIKEYSEANGIALVFVVEDVNLETARSREEFAQIVNSRKVIYYAANFNITSQIKLAMNTKFTMGTGGRGRGGAGGGG